MDLVGAIKNGFRNYASGAGRASRSEYWYWMLFSTLVWAGALLLSQGAFAQSALHQRSMEGTAVVQAGDGALAGTRTLESVRVGQAERRFVLVRPSRSGPLPTVIVLHGRGGQAAGLPQATGLGPLARREGFVAVFPEGTQGAWNSTPFLAQDMAQAGVRLPDDVAFLKTLVASLIARGITDPNRVYLAGFSNGGFMTLRAVCEGVGLFAGIATISANMPDVTGSQCRPARAVAFLAVAGTADRKVPYAGGPNRNGPVWSAEQGIGFFNRLNGCNRPPEVAQLPAPEPQASGVTAMRWSQCAQAPVALYRIEGGTHRIPDPSFTAEALWSFFRDRSLLPSGPPAAENAVAPAVTEAPPRVAVPSAALAQMPEEEVTFSSNGYMLHGCLTHPAGSGPFPAVIYNHGSEKDTTRCGPPALVRAYLEHGYAFFAFDRHGHGLSPGPYILDQQRAPGGAQRSVALHEEANRDVVGAVAWLMHRPEVDPDRVVMTGVSYGGIQTLLTAEKGLGIRAFVSFAPAAQSWGDQGLQQRLARAVRTATAPIFLAQAQNDYSLGPSMVLGPMVRAKGMPNEAKVYPTFGTTHQQGHGGFAVRGGIPVWSADVFAFLDTALTSGSKAPHANLTGSSVLMPAVPK